LGGAFLSVGPGVCVSWAGAWQVLGGSCLTVVFACLSPSKEQKDATAAACKLVEQAKCARCAGSNVAHTIVNPDSQS
jgi:hypothetical protein